MRRLGRVRPANGDTDDVGRADGATHIWTESAPTRSPKHLIRLTLPLNAGWPLIALPAMIFANRWCARCQKQGLRFMLPQIMESMHS